MPYLIGTDEAGYGPNLGPLVVAASVWEVPPETPASELYSRLENVASAGLTQEGDGRLPLADSKVLYKAGNGLAILERSVLCALAASGKSVRKWRELWTSVVHHAAMDCFSDLPWHVDFDLDLPVDTPPELIASSLRTFEEGLATAKVRIVALHSAAVFPREFNALVARTDSKGEALSLTTLYMVQRMLALVPGSSVQVTCDKHGGRNQYAALLQHVFPDALLSVRREGREESIYRIREGGRQVDFHFMAKGERLLPTALASMLAKYLRELAMKPFNEFWLRHVPGLRPTAGYPEDALRFRGEITAAQRRLGIADEVLWRCR